MTSKKLMEKLSELDACTEGKNFAKGKTLKKAWAECERPDWMLWLYRRASNYSQINVVKAAVFAAELVINIFEAKYPGDDRPRKAIEAAKRCLETPSPETQKAASASDAAASYASTAASAAAYAAAYAADAAAAYDAADATAAATAAANAAAAASDAAAARAEVKKKVCDFIRETCGLPEFK